MKEELPKIVFATNNLHKLEEARAVASGYLNILSLSDIGCHDDIPETASTLEGNALIKARWVKEKYGYDCFADDTGLMVEALGGSPGVYSARYAGPQCDARDNMHLLLDNMRGVSDRKAKFVTVIALIKDGEERVFRGEVEGTIAESPRGEAGFGYDPIFIARESGLTFAMMTAEAKNAISHRGRAMAEFLKFIST